MECGPYRSSDGQWRYKHPSNPQCPCRRCASRRQYAATFRLVRAISRMLTPRRDRIMNKVLDSKPKE